MKSGLTLLAVAMAIDGGWTHDPRLIIAAVAVYLIWPLISDDVTEVAKCTGCQRHYVKPGCPVHDPEASRGRDPEAMSATGRAE